MIGQAPNVISRYTPYSWIKLIALYAGVAALAIICILSLNWVSITVLSIFLTLIWYSDLIRTIIVKPEEIELLYVTGKREVIDYLEIKAIVTKRSKNRDGSLSHQKQELKLTGNYVIDLAENEFSNYEELKHAIQNYRLKAFEEQMSNDAHTNA